MEFPNTIIIAEAGVNHNGDIGLAMKMVDVAACAGVDAIKFQAFKAEKVVSKYAQKADYQSEATTIKESQLEMIKKLELDKQSNEKLFAYCKVKKIKFLSTPFDLESIQMLNELGVDTIKIPSGEITNLPYLREIGALKKKIILSTGMADLEEIKTALDILSDCGTILEDITVLHCNTEYPTPFNDVNLRAMLTIQKAFPKVNIGYSDHTNGIEIPIAAVALGAKIIEKHFTLDNTMEGPDHKASIDPNELKSMVIAIRNIEKALGNGIKKPSISEKKNISIVRKSILAACDIKKGEIFTDSNITVKRPGTGKSPMLWDKILGQTATKDYHEDDFI